MAKAARIVPAACLLAAALVAGGCGRTTRSLVGVAICVNCKPF